MLASCLHVSLVHPDCKNDGTRAALRQFGLVSRRQTQHNQKWVERNPSIPEPTGLTPGTGKGPLGVNHLSKCSGSCPNAAKALSPVACGLRAVSRLEMLGMNLWASRGHDQCHAGGMSISELRIPCKPSSNQSCAAILRRNPFGTHAR